MKRQPLPQLTADDLARATREIQEAFRSFTGINLNKLAPLELPYISAEEMKTITKPLREAIMQMESIL